MIGKIIDKFIWVMRDIFTRNFIKLTKLHILEFLVFSKSFIVCRAVAVSLFILIKKTLQGLQALQPNNNTKLIIKKNNS